MPLFSILSKMYQNKKQGGYGAYMGFEKAHILQVVLS